MTIPPHNPKLIVPTDGFENNSWTNGDRANSAKLTIENYRQQRQMDPIAETLAIDLMTDILHFLHSEQIDPFLALEKTKRHFKNEATGVVNISDIL